MTSTKKTRAFVVTQWNLDCDYQSMVDKKLLRFIAYGEEVAPTTGKLHHQAYVYFWNQRHKTKSSCKKIGDMFGPKHCHVEPMEGSFQHNEAYCSKDTDGLLTKFGDEPQQGVRGDLDETKDMILKGELTTEDVMESNPQMYHMYGRTLDKLQEIAFRKKWRTWMTKGLWIHGPSGAGKSHMAFDGFTPETHYTKCLSDQWWDGYTGQETVILNEFRGQLPAAELFDLVDKWPKTVKVRCRAPVPFLARRVIVTSIHDPKEFMGGEPWEQFQRRFDVIELDQKCPEGNNKPLGQKRKRDEGDG